MLIKLPTPTFAHHLSTKLFLLLILHRKIATRTRILTTSNPWTNNHKKKKENNNNVIQNNNNIKKIELKPTFFRLVGHRSEHLSFDITGTCCWENKTSTCPPSPPCPSRVIAQSSPFAEASRSLAGAQNLWTAKLNEASLRPLRLILTPTQVYPLSPTTPPPPLPYKSVGSRDGLCASVLSPCFCTTTYSWFCGCRKYLISLI